MGNSQDPHAEHDHDSGGHPDRGLARIIIAGAVLLLHAVLLLALLRANLGPASQPHLRERIIWFNLQAEMHPLATKRSRKVEQRQPQRIPNQPTPSRSAQPPNISLFSLPIEPNQKNLSGLRDLLVNCAPENLANLDEAQRSLCRKLGAIPAYDPNAVDYTDRSDKIPGAKQWERELARKNAPLLLPCGDSRSAFNFLNTGGCIIANVANGFTFKEQYENQSGYLDAPRDNNIRPPPIIPPRDH